MKLLVLYGEKLSVVCRRPSGHCTGSGLNCSCQVDRLCTYPEFSATRIQEIEAYEDMPTRKIVQRYHAVQVLNLKINLMSVTAVLDAAKRGWPISAAINSS